MSNLPISEQYRTVAKKWVGQDSAANLLEESKSCVLSQLMAKLGDIPVSRAELQVKSGEHWAEYIEKMVKAREEANLLKVQLEYLKMKFQEEQSHNATRRAEMRL